MKNNDFKTAEAEFEKVVRLVPQIEEGHSSLGAVLMQVGKFSQAIEELEKALALKPGDVAAQTNLAWRTSKPALTRKRWLYLKSWKPRRGKSRVRIPLPRFLPMPCRPTLARWPPRVSSRRQSPKMKTAVAESPQNAELHDALGSLYAQQRSWPSAVSEFQKAIQLNPQLAAAHLHLGVALLMQQQAPPAIPELTVASQLAPENAWPPRNWARLMRRK